MTDIEDETHIDSVKFNLTTFLKANAQNCESVAHVLETKNTVKSHKSQITKGLTEFESMFKNLQNIKNSSFGSRKVTNAQFMIRVFGREILKFPNLFRLQFHLFLN